MQEMIHRIVSSFSDTSYVHSILSRSVLISADMAHGVHPNYSYLHQSKHVPELNKGIVLKTNCNGRYTTDALSAALLKNLSSKASIPIQDFVVSNESPCGSTIGPLLASKLGCLSLDIGAPQLGMHSIRETMGIIDLVHYRDLFYEIMKSTLINEMPNAA